VPVAIYNNTKGDRDADTRKAFEEPAWNNPVVRIVDADGKDVVPRHAGDWSAAGLLRVMSAALEKRDVETPPWLALLTQEAASRKSGLETAVFGMT